MPQTYFYAVQQYYELVSVESVELSVICYATEDQQKLVKCFGTIMGFDPSETEISTLRATGHYGDEINVLSVVLKDKKAETCAKKIFSSLGRERLRQILDTINLRFDGSRLFLRLSKFQAYLGRVVLVEGGDSVKAVIKFKGYLKGKTPLQILKESQLLGEGYA